MKKKNQISPAGVKKEGGDECPGDFLAALGWHVKKSKELYQSLKEFYNDFEDEEMFIRANRDVKYPLEDKSPFRVHMIHGKQPETTVDAGMASIKKGGVGKIWTLEFIQDEPPDPDMMSFPWEGVISVMFPMLPINIHKGIPYDHVGFGEDSRFHPIKVEDVDKDQLEHLRYCDYSEYSGEEFIRLMRVMEIDPSGKRVLIFDCDSECLKYRLNSDNVSDAREIKQKYDMILSIIKFNELAKHGKENQKMERIYQIKNTLNQNGKVLILLHEDTPFSVLRDGEKWDEWYRTIKRPAKEYLEAYIKGHGAKTYTEPGLGNLPNVVIFD